MAADLVPRQVSVITATGGTITALVAQKATTTIPTVFQIGNDPVQAGLVASLNRPAGNLTGITTLTAEINPKRLELLHEMVPSVKTIAMLTNPASPTYAARERESHEAARILGVQLLVVHASSESDFVGAFEALAQAAAGALFINPDPFLNSHSEELAVLALRNAVPAIFHVREFAAAGGLMSYGGSNSDAYRQVGTYAGRILKGEKPADLPVHQSSKPIAH
jgi:putative ABC transport system substrate-binding protein